MYHQEPIAPVKIPKKLRKKAKAKEDDAKVAEFMQMESSNYWDSFARTSEKQQPEEHPSRSIEDTIDTWLTENGILRATVKSKQMDYFAAKRQRISSVVGDDHYSCTLESPVDAILSANRFVSSCSIGLRLQEVKGHVSLHNMATLRSKMFSLSTTGSDSSETLNAHDIEITPKKGTGLKNSISEASSFAF